MITHSLSNKNRKKKILCVDNESDITSLLKMTLERAEFSVDTFNDPSSALKSFKPNLYDLVVLDILMPYLDGFELYKQLKKLDPDIRICFLTACEIYHEENGKEKQCNLDKNLFLQMPMPLKKIVEEINKRLDSR